MVDSNASVLVVSATGMYGLNTVSRLSHSRFALYIITAIALYRRMGQDDSISFLGSDFDGSFFQDSPGVEGPDRKGVAIMWAPLPIQDRRCPQYPRKKARNRGFRC